MAGGHSQAQVLEEPLEIEKILPSRSSQTLDRAALALRIPARGPPVSSRDYRSEPIAACGLQLRLGGSGLARG